MTAGFDARADIWRMSNLADDSVGGAVISGSVVQNSLLTRLDSIPPSQLLLQQGLETQRTFSAIIIPGTLDIRERDEYQIVAPDDHFYYGDRFRIVGIQSMFNPRNPNNYMILSLVRSVRAHDVQ